MNMDKEKNILICVDSKNRLNQRKKNFDLRYIIRADIIAARI